MHHRPVGETTSTASLGCLLSYSRAAGPRASDYCRYIGLGWTWLGWGAELAGWRRERAAVVHPAGLALLAACAGVGVRWLYNNVAVFG